MIGAPVLEEFFTENMWKNTIMCNHVAQKTDIEITFKLKKLIRKYIMLIDHKVVDESSTLMCNLILSEKINLDWKKQNLQLKIFIILTKLMDLSYLQLEIRDAWYFDVNISIGQYQSFFFSILVSVQ